MFLKTIICCLCAMAGLSANMEQGGILLQKMTPDMLEGIGLKGKHGVIVTDLNESLATEGGIKQGDVIIQCNGQEVHSPEQLMQAFDKSTGEKVPLIVWRDDQKVKVFIEKKTKNLSILGGAEFANTERGVVVKNPGVTGLFEFGDLILQFNDKPVDDKDDITKAVAKKPNAFSVVVNRNGIKISQTFAVDKNGRTSFSQTISVARE